MLKQNLNDYAAAKENLESLNKQAQEATSLLQRLKNMKSYELASSEAPAVSSVSVSDLVELESEQAKINHLKENLDKKINEFVQCGHFLCL